jgi:glycosyltransferase involved in cell wall biosynthesis
MTSNFPEVSVVLANLNGMPHLRRAVASVAGQSFGSWEFVFVDTGSIDGSGQAVLDLAAQDDRVRAFTLPEIMNYPAAINYGIERCRGRFIARIESDDAWLPSKLERQVSFMNEPANARVGICGADAWLVDGAGRRIGLKRYPKCPTACRRAIWYRNPLCHSSVLCRRQVFQDAGLYDADKYLVEDLDLWLRISAQWEIANLDETLVEYRIWPGSLTARRLAEIARLSRKVRREAAKRREITATWPANMVHWLSYLAPAIPPNWVRWGFGTFIRLVEKIDNDSGRRNRAKTSQC